MTGSSKASPRKQMPQPEQQGPISSLAKHRLSWGDTVQPRNPIPVNSHYGPDPRFSLPRCGNRGPTRAPQTHYSCYRTIHSSARLLGPLKFLPLPDHPAPHLFSSGAATPHLSYQFHGWGQDSFPCHFSGPTESYSRLLKGACLDPTPTISQMPPQP